MGRFALVNHGWPSARAAVFRIRRPRDGPRLGELAKPADFSRGLAETGRRLRKGRARTAAALAGEHDAGHLPAVRTGVAAPGTGAADELGAVEGTKKGVCSQSCAN